MIVNKALVVILVAITLDAVGIGLIFPIMPALLREVTGSGEISALYGVMLAIYAFMQFVFAPILGTLSDRFGRRPVLLIAMAGAAADYVLMAFAPHLWILVVGRMIAGLTSANLAVCTAYIADISNEKQRARRFGFFHACFGIGFIIGPVLGGLLGDIWVRAPFLAAAFLNGLNFAVALFLLPESRKGQKTEWKLSSLNPFVPLKWAFSFKALLPMMLIYVVINFVAQTYGTVWVLFTEDRFLWSSFMVGISLAGYGLTHALAQALLTEPATKILGQGGAVFFGITIEVASLLILAFIFNPIWVFVMLPFFALGGVGLPALQSIMTNQIDADHQGRLQGVLSSLVSLTAIFGPLVFSWIYFLSRDVQNGMVWIAGAMIYLVCMPMVWRLRNAGYAH